MKKLALLLILILLCSGFAYARPQYSILQGFGAKCQACHVNTQGGGARNNPGWMSRKDISLIQPSTIGLGGLFNALSTNQAFGELITYGVDFRYQSARFGGPAGPERKNMVMQTTPYLSINPTSWFFIEGQYNVAYEIEKDLRYIGQQPYAFSANFKIAENLPRLRVGYFQPPIGTKYDDHTLLIRMVAGSARSNPVIPDDYAEFGAQLDYDPFDWLSVNLGAFQSKNMSALTSTINPNDMRVYVPYVTADTSKARTIPVVDQGVPSIAGRILIAPTLPFNINAFFGGTFFINSGTNLNKNGFYFSSNFYEISSLFLHIGMLEKFALMTEYIHAKKQNSRTTDNFLVELTYQPLEAANIFFRFEQGNTNEVFQDKNYHSNQYVIGAHIFPLPFIDLLPEYRIYDRQWIPGHAAQWAFQAHIFY
ncbi:MAG: hypothetical protein WCT77_10285 [Bacteroidota bacterium]